MSYFTVEQVSDAISTYPTELFDDPETCGSPTAKNILEGTMGIFAWISDLYLKSEDSHLPEELRDLWPDLWTCMQVFLRECVDKEAHGNGLRTGGYQVLSLALRSIAGSPTTREAVAGTPGLIRTMTKYWLKHEHLTSDTYALDKLYRYLLDDIFLDGRIDFRSEVLEAADGRPELVAQTCLNHLRAQITRESPNVDAIAVELLITRALCWTGGRELTLAFLAEGGLQQIVRTLETINAHSRPITDNVKDAAFWCIDAVNHSLHAPNNMIWAVRAIDAGIVPAVIDSAPVIKELDSELQDSACKLFSHYLTPFLVFRSVVKAAAKVMRDRALLRRGDRIEGPLYGPWLWFLGNFDRRYDDKVVFDTHKEAAGQFCCDYRGCPDPSNPSTLKSCTGCISIHYCSTTCQRAHWPEHKKDCRAAQKSIRNGVMVTASLRESRFLLFIASQELDSRTGTDTLRKLVQSKCPSLPRNSIRVLMDYTVVPTKIDVQDISTISEREKQELKSAHGIYIEEIEKPNFIVKLMLGVPKSYHYLSAVLSVPDSADF